MSIAKAIELVTPLEAVADMALVVLNPNDAICAYGAVRALDTLLFGNIGKFLKLLETRSRRLRFVVPTGVLFPKFDGVTGYQYDCACILSCLKLNRIPCTDASNLVGAVRTFDGEHFDDDAEPALLRAVEEWIVEAVEEAKPSVPGPNKKAKVYASV